MMKCRVDTPLPFPACNESVQAYILITRKVGLASGRFKLELQSRSAEHVASKPAWYQWA